MIFCDVLSCVILCCHFRLKEALFNKSINGQSFNVISIFLLKISNKMCQVLIIWTVGDVINFKIYLRSTYKAIADWGKKRAGKMEIQKSEYLEN